MVIISLRKLWKVSGYVWQVATIFNGTSLLAAPGDLILNIVN
jgi:hypothetical protein